MELIKKEEALAESSQKSLLIQETLTVVSFYMGDFLFGITADKIVVGGILLMVLSVISELIYKILK
jgi:hypothetical protein